MWKKTNQEAPGWLSQLSVRLLISAQVRSQSCEIEPRVSFHNGHGEYLRFPLSLSLCPSPCTVHARTIALSLSVLKKKANQNLRV